MGPEDPTRHVGVPDVARRGQRSADDRLPGRRDAAQVRRSRPIDDLHAMLKAHGDWMPLGGADEQKPAPEGTVEAWGRSDDQPGRRLVRPQEGPPRAGSACTCRRCSRRSASPRSPTTPRTTGCAPSDPWRVRAARRRPVRGPRRPEPAGHRRAARRRRTVRPGARRRPADQPAGRLAPPAPAEGGRAGRRGAARDAADLPAPRRGRRGGPGLPRAGLGRGGGALPARRRRTRRPAAGPRAGPMIVIEPIRLTLRGRLSRRPRLRGLDRAGSTSGGQRDHTVSGDART